MFRASSTAGLVLAALAASSFWVQPLRAQVGAPVPIQLTPPTPMTTRAARAAVQEIKLADDTIAVRLYSPWPAMVYQGYFPIVVEIENSSRSEEDVDLALSRGWSDNRMSLDERVTVAAGARVRRELFFGASRQAASSVNVEVRAAGDRKSIYNVGPSTLPDPTAYPVLYAYDSGAGAFEPAAGAAESWSEAAADVPPSNVPDVSQNNSFEVFNRRYSGMPATPTASAPRWHPAIAPIAIDELSPRYEVYTSLKGVILDVRGRLPRTEVLDALLSWTRLGGCLVLHGRDAERVARSIPGLAAWMEERFLQSSFGTNRVYTCAQGALVIADERQLDELTRANAAQFAGVLSAINAGLVLPRQVTQSPAQLAAFDGVAALAGMDLPYRGFAVLLILFALAIGPANLIAIKKTKRPALLLITVPALALFFSFGLFAYGVAAQGLGTRVATSSLTWLDQRSHQASTLELRSTFAGMPHGDGWRAGPGTSCYSLPDSSRQMTVGALRLDFDGGTSYRGDFLPVRREARNAFLVDRAARGRLEVHRGASAIEIENGLGATIEALALEAQDGSVWLLEGVLAPGGRAALGALSTSEWAQSARVTSLLGGAASLASRTELAPGSYVARLASSPFTDACGVDYVEEAHTHVVFGILDAEEPPR